jgi:hypothetical protein
VGQREQQRHGVRDVTGHLEHGGDQAGELLRQVTALGEAESGPRRVVVVEFRRPP